MSTLFLSTRRKCSFTSIVALAARTMSTTATPRPYYFHVGASWAGKPDEKPTFPRRGRKTTMSGFRQDTDIGRWTRQSLSQFTSPARERSPGEDFFYVQEMRNQSGLSLGVADGVGGWVDSGVDPALFAQSLMYHARQRSEVSWAGEPETDPTKDETEAETVEGLELPPLACLDQAYDGVMLDPAVRAGSSTGCIVHLDTSSGRLRAANLGDSGFLIIRSSAVIHSQPPQTHFFNCPRQIAKIPRVLSLYRDSIQDVPQDADLYETKLRDGDLVILFTDGLSDNVFDPEVAQICSLVSRTGETEAEQVQNMADRIVDYARVCMSKRDRVSPFQQAAKQAGYKYKGGKVDDVTVIVAMVKETG